MISCQLLAKINKACQPSVLSACKNNNKVTYSIFRSSIIEIVGDANDKSVSKEKVVIVVSNMPIFVQIGARRI